MGAAFASTSAPSENQAEYGPKFTYDPQWQGPMSAKREFHDCKYLCITLIIFVFWLSIGLWGVYLNESQKIESRTEPRYGRILLNSPIEKRNNRAGALTAVWIICNLSYFLSSIISLTFVYLVRWIAEVLVWFLYFFLIILLLLTTCGFGRIIIVILMKSDDEIARFVAFMITIIYLCVIVCILTLLYMVHQNHKKFIRTAEVLKEASRAITGYPSLCIVNFVGCLCCLVMTVFSFYFGYAWGDWFWNRPFDDRPGPGSVATYGILASFIIFFYIMASFWLIGFTSFVLRQIEILIMSIWYWTLDKSNLPWDAVPYSVMVTLWYQLGSVSHALLTVLRASAMMHTQYSHRRRGYHLHHTHYVYDGYIHGVYVRTWDDATQLLVKIATYGTVMCALHGANFSDSAKEFVKLSMRNRNFFEISRYGEKSLTYSCITFSALVPALIALCMAAAMRETLEPYFWETVAFAAVGSWIVASSLNNLSEAVDVLVLCAMEDYERNDGSSARPYFMSDTIKELILGGG